LAYIKSMNKIYLKIVTPERVLHDGEVSQVTLPTLQGQITVLPQHIPLITVMAAGEIEAKTSHEVILIAVEGGFVEVKPDGLVILADAGQMATEIDEKKVNEAIERAQKALETTEVHDHNYEILRAMIERETSKLKIYKKYREHGHSKRPETNL